MQKINLKKTTKEQMLNMLEKAWNANAGAADEYHCMYRYFL